MSSDLVLNFYFLEDNKAILPCVSVREHKEIRATLFFILATLLSFLKHYI